MFHSNQKQAKQSYTHAMKPISLKENKSNLILKKQ